MSTGIAIRKGKDVRRKDASEKHNFRIPKKVGNGCLEEIRKRDGVGGKGGQKHLVTTYQNN